MVKITKYNPDKIYMLPNGELATSERILQDFPAITTFPHIIETDELEQIIFAVDNLSAIRSLRNIDSALSDDEAMKVLEDMRNAPIEQEVSAQERIAAALEFNNLLNM